MSAVSAGVLPSLKPSTSSNLLASRESPKRRFLEARLRGPPTFLGKGGLKGGKARAREDDARERADSAQKAALAHLGIAKNSLPDLPVFLVL